MNIAIRKLAMLEKSMAEKVEEARVQGYSTCPIDREFQKKVNDIMDRVRVI